MGPLPQTPEDGGGEAGNPEVADGCGDESERGVERGDGVRADEEGEEVAGGLRMKDQGCDAGEAAAGQDFHGALRSVEILGVAESEMNHGDGEKAGQREDGRDDPRREDGGGDHEVNRDGRSQSRP